jgi:hypothetical protein
MANSPEELMAEMERISKHWSSVGLLLAYPEKTTRIPRENLDALDLIAFGLRSGGKALAWYGIDSNGAAAFKLRPEYSGQEWALEALKAISEEMRKAAALEREGKTKGPPIGSS